MGNDKAFSGRPQGRGSYPPHTGLSPWIVHYSFMEAVAVKDSCSHAYPTLLLLVPPFRGLFIGRTWLRHFSILSTSLYYQHFFFFLSIALWVHKITGAFFSEMSVVKRFPLTALIHLTLAWCPLNGEKKKKPTELVSIFACYLHYLSKVIKSWLLPSVWLVVLIDPLATWQLDSSVKHTGLFPRNFWGLTR